MPGRRANIPQRVSFTSDLPFEDAVSYFEALVTAFKRGSITIRHSEEAVTLRPPSQVEVQVKASSFNGKEWVSFEVSWQPSKSAALRIEPE